MIAAAWTRVPLAGDAAPALAALPAVPGVAQIVGPSGQDNLVIGRAADLRRWAASHLGLGKAPPKGVRPPVDLRPIASAVLFTPTASQFQQRLVYERLMAQYVPLERRRDLKVPAYLRLDLAQRFPRIEIVTDPAGEATFGPFKDRRGAQRAQAALHKRMPLRPCDFVFEPHPALPLGTACLYAQVRSCAAPCLCRTSEAEYGALATEAERLLESDAREAETEAWLPAWVGRVGTRAVVVETTGDAVQIYPVDAGTVLEAGACTSAPDTIEEALAGLDWRSGAPSGCDLPWLSSWLCTSRRTGRFRRLS